MPYCVNCGADTRGVIALCPKCFRDPGVPRSQWEQQLSQLVQNPYNSHYHDFSYRGEKLALVFAIFVSFFSIVILSIISLGLIPLSFVVAFFFVKIRWLRTRASLMPITEDSYPNLYRMARVAAARLRIPVPPMFVEQSPMINAYTTGLFNDNWIVLYSGLVEAMSDDEVMTVIGHEMGHIKLRHVTWMIFAGTGGASVNIPWLSLILGPIFNMWHLRAEYSADRAGLIASGSADACVRTDIKLLTGRSLPPDFDLDKYVKNIMSEEVPLHESVLEVLYNTHPFARKRIRQIVSYSNGDEFRQIWNTYSKPNPAIVG